MSAASLVLVGVLVSGDEDPRALSGVVAGCERALGAGACAPAAEPRPARLGTVRFGAGGVEVTLTAPRGVELARSLTFPEDEGDEQRWLAAGLLVAALLAAVPDEPAAERAPSPRPPAQPAEDAAQPAEDAHRGPAAVPLRLGLGLVGGAGPSFQTARVGGELGVWGGLSPRLGYTLGGAVTHTVSAEPRTLVGRARAGLTLSLLPPSAPRLLAWLGPVLEWDTVRVAEAEPAEQRAVRAGGFLGLRLELGSGPFGGYLGATVDALAPELVTTLDGVELARSTPVVLEGALGLWLAPTRQR